MTPYIKSSEQNMERTYDTAHIRIDALEKEVIAIKTEVLIQFKDLFGRVKRLETILLTATPTPTYQQLRASAYPPAADYLDAIVKGDTAQAQAYIDECLAVKAKYPK